jgi:hypothetical protein
MVFGMVGGDAAGKNGGGGEAKRRCRQDFSRPRVSEALKPIQASAFALAFPEDMRRGSTGELPINFLCSPF